MLKLLRNFINGLAFGVTQIVPGVSGGTVAIILGFYFELIHTINHFTENVRKHLGFLLPLVLGAVAGLVLFSSLINYLLIHFSFPTMLFFIGLIVGIIPHIFSRVREGGGKFGPKEILLVLIPFVLLLAVSVLRGGGDAEPVEATVTVTVPFMFFIFFAGFVAAAALVIPGVSGSFVLLLLGIYHQVIDAVSSIRIWLADAGNHALLLDICMVLVPLALGIIVGGLFMVRLIERLLRKHHGTLYSVILGLLSGSVIVLFTEPMVYRSGVSALIVAAGVAAFLLGGVLSFCLGRKRL